MKIITRYSIGDKIWFMVPNYTNKYTWGEVIGINISINEYQTSSFKYTIKNRFYKNNYDPYLNLREKSFRDHMYLYHTEDTIYSSEKELFDCAIAKKEIEISELSQFSKNLFNL